MTATQRRRARQVNQMARQQTRRAVPEVRPIGGGLPQKRQISGSLPAMRRAFASDARPDPPVRGAVLRGLLPMLCAAGGAERDTYEAIKARNQMTVQPQRYSHLSPAWQALVRLFQAVNFGEIQGVHVRDANPIFDQASVVVIDAKLDKVEVPRPELDLVDFELCAEVSRLMSRLDELKNGTIQRLEVHAGIPRRLVFESRLLEAPGAQAGLR